MLKRTRRIELRFRNADERAEGDVGDQHFVLARICARRRVVRNRKASNIGCYKS